MDVTLNIVEEYLVPFLTEDISRESGPYFDYIATVQDHLSSLGKNDYVVYEVKLGERKDVKVT